VSPKPLLPGHLERVTTPLSPLTSHTGAALASSDVDDKRSVAEQRNYERFLKINVRHITDGQVGYSDCGQLVLNVTDIHKNILCSEFWQFLTYRVHQKHLTVFEI